MEIYMVNAMSKTYPIYLSAAFDGLPQAIADAGLQGRRAVVVTDENVAPLYLPAVKALLSGVFTAVDECVLQAGEAHKNLAAVQTIYTACMDAKADRKSVLVALGGGVIGDMTGFAAATYMRGVPFIQIPTTLLSQVDSSVGGKTGVDFSGAKNMIGAFNQPELVYINTETLRTLPCEQIISGMGEVVKHGLILDAAYYNYLNNNAEAIAALDADVMQHVVRGSCEIKASVVSQDERESGLREILNYGHTFGHAAESAYNFALPHGHCVSLGIVCAMAYAVAAGDFQERDRQSVENALQLHGLPTRLPKHLPKPALADVYALMFADKKAKSGVLNLVLPTAIGAVTRAAATDAEAVLHALEAIY